ncbi:DUF655 domain-containing protein [Candidatus Woesearchaeota archaeon]|nr:DUF655 domain-containing protein [Candidatus Woesearchaeota archaeon]
MDEKEENAIVLDFLPNGYPFDTRPAHKKTPIAQAIGEKNFTILELIPKSGVTLQPAEKIYIGEGKRDQIHHIVGKIPISKLTQTAKGELEYVISDLVNKNEEKFIKFFNDAGPINTRRHQLELIPGIGKKHMWEIIEKRQEKPFTNFDDMKTRIKLLANPKKAVIKRILEEMEGKDKYRLFVK